MIPRRPVMLLFTVLLLIQLAPPLFARDMPVLARAEAVRDSLRGVWAQSDGFEHAVLTEQLGVWVYDENYVLPGGWDDRTQAMYELAMIGARRFDVDQPRYLRREEEPTPDTGIHWSKALRTLRRDLLTEEFETLQGRYFMTWPVLPAVQELAHGELALRRHEAEAAAVHFRRAVRQAPHPRVRGEAMVGISRALYEQNGYQAALDTLLNQLGHGAFSDDALTLMGTTLIRLGRVREAVELFQLTLEVNPEHERAHYMLGNGYTPDNYTELRRRAEVCFADSSQAERLALAKRHLRNNRPAQATAILQALAIEGPDLVEPRTILAELAWMDGAWETSRRLLFEALDACPDYGRAHAVFARVQEMRRLEQSARRRAVRDEFRLASRPQIAGIDTFISNWAALPEDVRKQVALAVEPWQAFVPALNAAGQTHYIKPMYERLSEAPQMESLRDQRINLDSRLWDDVRGVGGFHSVTGIEDVRRMSWGGYNTLVHELTHQVHGIFTPDQKRRLEELYRNAKTREAENAPAFLSRYQGSTVWEYFAEGVNAAVTPRLDEWDDREMIRERLEEWDQALHEAVKELLALTDVRENIAVAKVNSALQHLQHGHADSAWMELERVDDAWADKPYLLDARATVASILDRDDDAVQYAHRYVQQHPGDGGGWIQLASALEFTNVDSMTAMRPFGLPDTLVAPTAVLERGLAQARQEDRPRVRRAFAGRLYRELAFDAAITQYDSVLARQPGDPSATWGRALSRAEQVLRGETVDEAGFEQAVSDFEEAVRARSGVMELRLDYARALLRAGRLNKADAQIREAEALHPTSPLPKTYRAWYLAESGDRRGMEQAISDALALEPPPDAAYVLAQHFGVVDARPLSSLLSQWERQGPDYVYNPRLYQYEERRVIEPWMRALSDRQPQP